MSSPTQPQGHGKQTEVQSGEEKDPVTQAYECGDPLESGRVHGRYVDLKEAMAHLDATDQWSSKTDPHDIWKLPPGQQGEVGDDYESGRPDAVPGW